MPVFNIDGQNMMFFLNTLTMKPGDASGLQKALGFCLAKI